MPVEKFAGGIVITGNAIDGAAARVTIIGLDMYLKTGMQLSRVATPTVLLMNATKFTGKRYARSRKGMGQALADLKQLCDPKTLDEIGDTLRVNRAVGGVAADLDK